MRRRVFMTSALIAGAVLAAPAFGQTPAPAERGAAIFSERCKECHESGDDRTPQRAELAKKTIDEIVTALTTGPMAPVAEGLTPDDKKAVAAFLTTK